MYWPIPEKYLPSPLLSVQLNSASPYLSSRLPIPSDLHFLSKSCPDGRGSVMQQTPRSCPTNISPIKACISSSASTPRSLMVPHASSRLYSTSQQQDPQSMPGSLECNLDGGCIRNVRTWPTLCRRVSETVRSYRRRQLLPLSAVKRLTFSFSRPLHHCRLMAS
ncbi:hypothetical protein BKA83DRAFT_2429126 [Pisolithus microcarpus]|nr:hypothetical protein BKA83DRAFT_2429126 [Pisolithus microcarpus]